MKVILVEALKFGLVGLLNTAVGLGVIFFAIGLLGAKPIWANTMGYGLGLAISFVLNARWTFRSHVSRSILVRFLAAFAASYALNLVVLIGATRGGVGPYLSQMLAVASYTLAFLVLSKHFVFATSTPGLYRRCRALRRLIGLGSRNRRSDPDRQTGAS